MTIDIAKDKKLKVYVHNVGNIMRRVKCKNCRYYERIDYHGHIHYACAYNYNVDTITRFCKKYKNRRIR